ISMVVQNRWPYFVLNSLHIFLIIACGVLASVDLELYRHWGFRLNTAPLFYMKSVGAAAMGSVALTVVFKLLLIATALITIFLFLYDRLIAPRIAALKAGRRRGFVVVLAVTVLM